MTEEKPRPGATTNAALLGAIHALELSVISRLGDMAAKVAGDFAGLKTQFENLDRRLSAEAAARDALEKRLSDELARGRERFSIIDERTENYRTANNERIAALEGKLQMMIVIGAGAWAVVLIVIGAMVREMVIRGGI